MKYGFFALLFVAAPLFAQQQITVTPRTADPQGGAVVQIRGPLPQCPAVCAVTFGGVASPSVTPVAGGLDAVAPPHAEGVVKIAVGPLVLDSYEAQFAYVAPREQLLIPIAAGDVPGSYGALWSTEIWVHNGSDHDVALQPAVCDFIGLLSDCGGDRMIVKAGSARPLPAVPVSWYAIGEFLYPPRDVAAQISIDARLRDRSRAGAGTSLPVVRESAMHRQKLTMLNVPGDDARLRKRLRIYAYTDAQFIVRVYDLDTGRELAERQLLVQVPTDGPGQPFLAPTIQDDIFDGGAARLRVEVEQLFPTPVLNPWWAFISATDNVTQQVTIIAPQ